MISIEKLVLCTNLNESPDYSANRSADILSERVKERLLLKKLEFCEPEKKKIKKLGLDMEFEGAEVNWNF